jgi:hypothetical protein
VLSRLISLLRRIPAVKWAFTRLRPEPHGGSIDVAPPLASNPIADMTEAAPGLDSIVAEPSRCDAEAVAVEQVPASPIEPEPVHAPELVDHDPRAELPIAAEFAAEEAAPAPVVEAEREQLDAPEPVISDEPSIEASTELEPVVAEEISDDDAAPAVDAPVLIMNDEPSCGDVVDAEPVIADNADAALAESDVSPMDIAEANIESVPSSTAPDEIEPISTTVAVPVPLLVAETAPGAVKSGAPEPVLEFPAPKIARVQKARAKVTPPVDRATLIRQRWAETGIRMWNPRLHGAGDATLNIQGRVELLPPAPGETMPRYDKLEFTMLGGQIVCEGIIVEAPAHAGPRSFTRLAEPGKSERVREPVRERQAVLA